MTDFRRARFARMGRGWIIMFDRPKRHARQPRAGRPRRDVLLADAQARQRGQNLDGSPRRETLPVPSPGAQPAFDPTTSTWFVDVGGRELEAPTLSRLLAKLAT